MTDRCDLSGTRDRNLSAYEPSCQPTREQAATSENTREQDAAREAEARRDAYIASGTDEGGRSKRASSDASVIASDTKDDKLARVIANARKYDPPIHSDPLGNAIVGIVAGGILGGLEAGAGKVGLAGARGVFLQPMSRELVKQAVVGEATGGAAVATGAAAGAARSAVGALRTAAVVDGVPALAGKLVDATNRPVESGAGAPSNEASSVAGRSSKGAASVPVEAPNQSQAPRIPELLPPLPVRIQG